MNDTKIASKAKAQLAHFTGKVFTHFGKWVRTAADTIAKAHDAPAIQLLPGFAELLDIDDG